MPRKAVVVILVLAVALTVSSLASARPASGTALTAAQSDEPSTAPPFVSLALGERFVTQEFDLEVQDAFTVESPVRPGWNELRVSVVIRFGASTGFYSGAALTGEHGYPELQAVDSSGSVRTLGPEYPRFNQVQGSNLTYQPPWIPARWTLGFQVPTSFVAESLQAVMHGTVVATWDLTAAGKAASAWRQPLEFTSARFGDELDWEEDVEITPLAAATEVCGDPQYGHVTTLTSVWFEITNAGLEDALWPNVHYPETWAIAIWDDGASARVRVDTLDGVLLDSDDETDEEIAAAAEEQASRQLTPEMVAVPPFQSIRQVADFAVHRDGRFVDPAAGPIALVIYPPNGSQIWLDLSGVQLIEIIDDEQCSFDEHVYMIDRDGIAPVRPEPVEEEIPAS